MSLMNQLAKDCIVVQAASFKRQFQEFILTLRPHLHAKWGGTKFYVPSTNLKKPPHIFAAHKENSNKTTTYFSISGSSPAKVYKPFHDRPLSVSSSRSSQIRSFSPFRATIRSSQQTSGGVYGSVIYHHNRPIPSKYKSGK